MDFDTTPASDLRDRMLVAYTGDHPATRQLAEWLAHDLAESFVVELADLDAAAAPPLYDYDAVVIGAGVRIGRHPRKVISYIRDHGDELAAIPASFFSVGGHGAFARDAYVKRMTERTGWRPQEAATFGDAGEPQRCDLREFATRVGRAVPANMQYVH